MIAAQYFDCVSTSLGPMVLASNGEALTGAWFDGQRHQPPIDDAWRRHRTLPILRRATVELAEYFAGERTEFTLPLAPAGTPFQREVWQAIAAVPYGRTLAYRDLASAIGRPASVRAAAAATGRNPVSIVIPCHRIVGADGALTGYAGGIERKRTMLDLEQRARAALRAA